MAAMRADRIPYGRASLVGAVGVLLLVLTNPAAAYVVEAVTSIPAADAEDASSTRSTSSPVGPPRVFARAGFEGLGRSR